MPDTLTEIRKRVENEYEAEGEGAWPEECFVDARDLLAHVDAITARLGEVHWLLVNDVNRTDEAYLALLDWLEPLVTPEASERADDLYSEELHDA